MRHKGIDKEETKQRMIDAVGRGFRKSGFSGIGIEGLVKTAGVTSGAFYSHFGSKSGAFDIALTVGLDEVIKAIPEFQREYQSNWIDAFTEYYLDEAHRQNIETGCAMASLTPEVVRFKENTHAIFENKMTEIVELIAIGLSGGSSEELTSRAWSMLGILIGGINLSRAMKTTEIAEDVASAIKLSAIKVAGTACDFNHK
mgnify:CR=1 FL=1